ncbi:MULTISPECIES: YfhO family protein [unclassified Staphylococcus]|uniref:YfhO family protein n=1 Tax=unclassified Staphylococcus TaxID=91994 RepID=UPI00187F527B|nr:MULTISPECIES: YfhO family protein [unclassified Staphylococcus]MBF2756724.1 YfhO family protein [Staphylococcus haemolyticus]MBF2772779.1 YfhO family protein [Staphylococcus haemolyticus]MBF2775605.1 YfhO family protein [Staphylococcus haemolyticus]MBF2814906.1 YfhO family protein [Staphylococcus haemolyticus]MBF9720167.1 YfhO family protein [Staphylococcus haemolyticus]
MKKIFIYIGIFFTLSLLGHSYIIYRFIHDGILFTGPNDGIEQMVPIQMFLFEKWSHGNLFYASDFGLGGDFFTDLSYYFSTNILFIINVLCIILLKTIIHINTQGLLFWMVNALVISIIKAAIAMYCTYLYSKYLSRNTWISLIMAFLFVMSPLYYRFTVYWPFFSDVFIWLPLLLLSIERVLQKQKLGLFIVTVTLIMINNFYFAYYLCLIGAGYILIRIIFRHSKDIISRGKAIILFVISAILGLGNSLFMFFHGVQSFLNNRRVPFSGTVDTFEKLNINTNIFFDNYLIVLLFLTIQALLCFKLYKHYYYRLFAMLTLVFILLSFVPFIDQVFNGFSAPQKRWHFILSFNSAMLIGLFMKYFRTLKIKTYVFSNIIAELIIFASAITYHKFVAWLILVPIVSIIGLLILILKDRYYRINLSYIFGISILLLNIMVSFVFIKNQIYFKDHEERANTFYINSSLYSSDLQRSLVNIMNNSKREDERIDWRVNEQDNTPMYQHFKGLSLYSSIFHHNILDYYYDALKINLAEESLSRYQSTNGRQNIASLFSVRYMMLKDYQGNLPAYFKKIKTSGQYTIYENSLNLPSVKVTNNIYHSKSLNTAIDREHAMLNGVVMDNKGTSYKSSSPNLLSKVDIQHQNIKLNGKHRYKVTGEQGGTIKLHLPKHLRDKYDDFYLTMKIKRGNPDSNYTVAINNYANHRLFNNSTYRTGVDTQLYRAQPDKNGDITITLSPDGEFYIDLQQLNGENYDTLKKAHRDAHFSAGYKDIKNGVQVNLNHHDGGIAAINIPYRKGMHAYVDGAPAKVQKVNYMMTGVSVNKNAKQIVIKYQPPYWNTMIITSLISMLLSAIFIKNGNLKKRKMRK